MESWRKYSAGKTAFAKGLGNSMHAFFIPFGVYPNNAIVGGSAPIATGAALYKKECEAKGNYRGKCWRRIAWLRSRMGIHDLCIHGSISYALGGRI